MTEPYMLEALGRMGESAEIYYHPTEGDRLDPLGANPVDLATLLNPRVREAVERLESARYRDTARLRSPAAVDACNAASWTNA
jgi:hypothetical protein